LPNRLPLGFGFEVVFPNKLPIGFSSSFLPLPMAGRELVVNLNPPAGAGFSAESPVGGALLLIVTIFLLAIAS